MCFSGLDRVYCISQDLSFGSDFKNEIVWTVSWGLLWVFDRVCYNLPGVLFGVTSKEGLCLVCFEGCF